MVRPRPKAAITALVMIPALALVGCSAATNRSAPTPDSALATSAPPHSTPAQPTPPLATPAPTTPPPAHSPEPKPPKKPPAIKRVSQTIPKGSGPGGSLLSTGSKSVALTFDDGPDPINTPKMLDLLKHNRVKATFCLVGTQAKAYPALVRRIAAEGHTLCNHSWRHRLDLAKQTDEVVLKDLQATSDAIRAAVPKAKIKYFRAPGGNFTKHLVALARSQGMTSLYWTVDPRDWDAHRYGHGTSMVNHIITIIKAYARPGAIILSHDYRKPDTITAYKTLLPWLKARYKLIAMPT